MSKKFYVASTLSNAEEAKEVIEKLKSLGHEVTYDWTTHGQIDPSDKDRIAEVAEGEMKGVEDCDLIFVLYPIRGGGHAELGMALALRKKIVFVAPEVGSIRETSFYHHPAVLRLSDKNKAIETAHSFLSIEK